MATHHDTPTPRRFGAGQRPSGAQLRRIGISAALVLLAAALVIQFVLPLLPPLGEMEFSAESAAEYIRDSGPWGVAGSILLMVLHSFVPFPAEIITFANGMVYGPFWGTVVTWIGAMLGAVVAFAFARKLGRPFVRSVVPEPQWRRIDDWTVRQGWQPLFAARFLPIISFNLVNYAAGLTPIGWITFLWTTGLGILPVTVLMVFLGHSMTELRWVHWVGVAAAGLVLWGLLYLLGRRRARRAD